MYRQYLTWCPLRPTLEQTLTKQKQNIWNQKPLTNFRKEMPTSLIICWHPFGFGGKYLSQRKGPHQVMRVHPQENETLILVQIIENAWPNSYANKLKENKTRTKKKISRPLIFILL